MQRWSIYTLSDYYGRVRYVGITKLTLQQRLRDHLKCSRRHHTYRDKWIQSLGHPPIISLLEVTDDSHREVFWIAHFRAIGARLTNLTDGGDGISGYRHTIESREKMSVAGRGRKISAAARMNMSLARKLHFSDPKARMALSTALMGHGVSEETRKRIGNARRELCATGWKHPCTGKKHSAERIQKNRDAQLRRSALGIPGPRKGVDVSLETRAKLRAAYEMRRANGTAPTMLGKRMSEESRAKLSSVMRRIRNREPVCH